MAKISVAFEINVINFDLMFCNIRDYGPFNRSLISTKHLEFNFLTKTLCITIVPTKALKSQYQRLLIRSLIQDKIVL